MIVNQHCCRLTSMLIGTKSESEFVAIASICCHFPSLSLLWHSPILYLSYTSILSLKWLKLKLLIKLTLLMGEDSLIDNQPASATTWWRPSIASHFLLLLPSLHLIRSFYGIVINTSNLLHFFKRALQIACLCINRTNSISWHDNRRR